MTFRRAGGRKGKLIIALLLVSCPLLTVQAHPSDRAQSFEVAAILQFTEDYNAVTGEYNGLFPFLVNNTGDASGNGSLTVTGLPAGWTWELVEGQAILSSVPPDTTVRVTIHVQAKVFLAGEHQFTVTVDPGNAIAQFKAKVPFLGAIAMSCTQEAMAGINSPAKLYVIVTNHANAPDRLDLEVIPPADTWWYEADGPLTSPFVNISASHTWTVTMHAPYSAEAGIAYRSWFKVVSVTDGDTFAINSSSLQVVRRRAVALDFREPSYVQGDAGAVVTTEAILENEGNGLEQVALTVTAPEGWTSQLPKANLELDPFERTTLAVYISPAPMTISGDYSILLTARAAGGTISATTVTTIMIPYRSGLILEAAFQVGPDPAPGAEVPINFTVRNAGNHLELVQLYPTNVPDGWAVTIIPSVISMPAWAQVQVTATVMTSRQPLQSLAGAHIIGIGARSLFTDAQTSVPATVNVRPVARLDLSAVVPVWAINPMVDPDPVYIFGLRNTGNVQVTASLVFTSSDGHAGWLRPSRAAITVAAGDTGYFHATVLAPDHALVGLHSFTVTATTQEAEGATAMADIAIDIIEANLKVTAFQARAGGANWSSDAKVIQGQPIEVIAWLKDDGADPVGRFDIALYADGVYVMNRTMDAPAVPKGTIWGVTFEQRLAQGSHNISVRVSAPSERDISDNEAHARVRVEPAQAPVRNTAAVAGISVTTTLLIIGAILANEGWKFKAILILLVPLYTRIKPEAALDNFTRGRIYGYIEANPGEHYNAIKKALELPNGSLAHHLDMLMREGYVRFEADGNYKRFYPSHMRPFRTPLSRKPARIQEIILDFVRDEPGISERAIARTLGLSPSTVNYHIRLMATSGVLRLERSLGRTLCHLGEKAPPEGTDIEGTVEEEEGA